MQVVDDFRAGFVRSKKGNVWRSYTGLTVSVFRSKWGYRWSIADASGPTFSKSLFRTEEGALKALEKELGLEVE